MSDYPDAAKHEWWNKARNSQLDRLRKTEAERDRLRAEVERLTTHSGALESALFAKTSELYPGLRSELDRLRAEKDYIIRRLMSAVDQSNWDEDLKGERFKGFEEAMELIHEMIMDFLRVKANETEGKLGGGGAAGDDPGFSTGSR